MTCVMAPKTQLACLRLLCDPHCDRALSLQSHRAAPLVDAEWKKHPSLEVSCDYSSWQRGAGGHVEQAHDKLVVLHDRYGGLKAA